MSDLFFELDAQPANPDISSPVGAVWHPDDEIYYAPYQDANGNGTFDEGDTIVVTATRGSGGARGQSGLAHMGGMASFP